MSSPRYILGVSAFYHDTAACLLRDGNIVAAAQEERFTRKKGDSHFPESAIDYCLSVPGISVNELEYVGFYDKPLLKFERILETYLGVVPKGFGQFLKAGPLWMKEKVFMDKQIRDALSFEGELLYGQHHESHAASAFFPSPFEEAAILTMDGVGEWATASIGVGRGNEIELLKEIHWPDSLGLLYSAFTYYTGFKVNSGEYKVMGLAPYGQPKYVDLIYRELIDLRDDGSFTLNQKYFNYLSGLTMTSQAFHDLFGGPPRQPESSLSQREMDLACSVQEVCEEVMLRMARKAHHETGSTNLCLAGGVALNCVGNGRILREGPFERLWIQPAAGDAGGALGVAQLIWHRHCAQERTCVPGRDAMQGAYLGPEFTPDEIQAFLESVGASYQRCEYEDLLRRVAGHLAQEKVVGWFSGRMEFGPRALGGRSILGDPRSATMQAEMNLKIKFREGFRPFAPSILREHVSEYFEIECDSPYMLLVAPVKKERCIPMTETQEQLWGIDKLNLPRSDIPAVTHIDYSARVQTVSRDTSPAYYDLIKEFGRQTGCPVLINTSFNVRGEPNADQHGLLGDGSVCSEQGRTARVAGDREMAGRVPTRLSSAEGRRFALTVGAAFSVLGALAWWRERPTVAAVLGGVGISLIVAGLVVPGRLGPVYRGWMSFAKAISTVTTPIFLGIVYFVPITVTGLAMRLLGKNPMRRRSAAGSFWVATDNSSDLHRQF